MNILRSTKRLNRYMAAVKQVCSQNEAINPIDLVKNKLLDLQAMERDDRRAIQGDLKAERNPQANRDLLAIHEEARLTCEGMLRYLEAGERWRKAYEAWRLSMAHRVMGIDIWQEGREIIFERGFDTDNGSSRMYPLNKKRLQTLERMADSSSMVHKEDHPFAGLCYFRKAAH